MRTAPLIPLTLALAACSDSNPGDDGGARGSADLVAVDLAVPVDLARPDLRPGSRTLDPGQVSVSPKTAWEAETHVAVADNGFVAVAYIGLQKAAGQSTNGYTFSKNDGETFEAPQVLSSPGGRVASDPVLAADAAGNFYMSWVGFSVSMGQPADMHVYVARAPAGTTTFGTPIEVTQNPMGQDSYDKPWILAENDGTLLVTYARVSSGGIFAATSKDLSHWDNQKIVEDGSFRNLVFPCQPESGSRVYAVYHAGAGIGLRRSDDGGRSWPDANKSAVAAMTERPAFEDPTCAAAGDDVWVSYGLSHDVSTEAVSAKLYGIRLAHSPDGGRSIDGRYDAHDGDAGTFFLHPYLVREAGGALDLVYYAGTGENDDMGSFRRARSTDGGKSFAPSSAVHSPLTFLGARNSHKWLGDYAGLAAARGNLYTAFTDNSSGESHVRFYRTATPPK